MSSSLYSSLWFLGKKTNFVWITINMKKMNTIFWTALINIWYLLMNTILCVMFEIVFHNNKLITNTVKRPLDRAHNPTIQSLIIPTGVDTLWEDSLWALIMNNMEIHKSLTQSHKLFNNIFKWIYNKIFSFLKFRDKTNESWSKCEFSLLAHKIAFRLKYLDIKQWKK